MAEKESTQGEHDDDHDDEEGHESESDDSEDEELEEENCEIRLGFIDDAPQELDLLSLNDGFPNKVGGKPVWLDVEHLPPSGEFICKKCGKQMIFLLQIYAPIPAIQEAFHRTLFVFCCKNGACKNFKVIRAQLPRENRFYTNEEHEDDIQMKEESDYNPVCEVCGCHGPKRCARCHNAYYCSREHQEEDWRVGHSDICKKIQAWKKEHGLENATELPKSAELPTFQKYPSHFLFKEMEVITDLEPGVATEKDLPDIEKKGLMSKYNDYLKNWTKKDNAELNDDFKSGPSDKTFSKFHNRLSRDPEQILRYCRSETAQPLWVSSKGQATPSDIPNCPLCNGPRKFEFQILPQLLYFLGVDEHKESTPVDWGILAIYTCWNSCSIGKDKGSAEEFLWFQEMV